MPIAQTATPNDPIVQALARVATRRSGHPVPLIATRYAIRITGGLAAVTATRRFRNAEAEPIEATLTFPLPVAAVLHGLEARIGERVLQAVAVARKQARETYEDAIERGKATVLHEELIAGIHMLSVGQLAPGAEIEVTVRFALPLAWVGHSAQLRIPTTVGDVYGCSGLPDSDELEHGGTPQSASLTIVADAGSPVLGDGTRLENGAARVPLDRPIDVTVEGWAPRPLVARTEAGAEVTLRVEPAPAGAAALDLAILVDRSGSMGGDYSTGIRGDKLQLVIAALASLEASLRSGDRIDLWQFDDGVQHLGVADREGWPALVRSIAPPGGGTAIGGAVEAALAHRTPRDVLLITDGKSYALDVQKLAARGVRVTVLLIGEDSLDAHVGHLAQLTGGSIFIAGSADARVEMRAALAVGRCPQSERPEAAGRARLAATTRSGMRITAQWSPAREVSSPAPIEADLDRAVSAYAASLQLASLDEESATRLAIEEGLVGHLTSLVLVDEEAAARPGLPATRKVALPTPAAGRVIVADDAMFALSAVVAPAARAEFPAARSRSVLVEKKGSRIARSAPRGAEPFDRVLPVATVENRLFEASLSVRRIPWSSHAASLAKGDLSGLDVEDRIVLESLAVRLAAMPKARKLAIPAPLLAIALLASMAAAAGDRHARRVARVILGRTSKTVIDGLVARLGLGQVVP